MDARVHTDHNGVVNQAPRHRITAEAVGWTVGYVVLLLLTYAAFLWKLGGESSRYRGADRPPLSVPLEQQSHPVPLGVDWFRG